MQVRSNSYLLLAAILFLLLTMPQCAANNSSAANLPHDIFGISVGMNKADAQRLLEDAAFFERDERRRQQVWRMKSNPNYGFVLIGYDKENKVRYVTAVAREKGGKKVRYDEIADLKLAKIENLGIGRRYTWLVGQRDGKPEYLIVAQGNETEFLSLYTISQAFGEEAADEDSE